MEKKGIATEKGDLNRNTQDVYKRQQLQEESQKAHLGKVGGYCSLLVLDDTIDRICPSFYWYEYY